MKRALSGDTDELATPAKRLRRNTASPCPSENTPSPSRTIRAPLRKHNFDLYDALCRCREETDPLTIDEIRALPCGKVLVQSVQKLLHTGKINVKRRADKSRQIIMTELYLQWLEELDFAVTGIENLLNAKIPGTRRRVPGLGRVTFAILYRTIDSFISDVDNHHDGWSYRDSEEHPIYPATMTLAEEAKDPSTDLRAEITVRRAEETLGKYDRVMELALRRLKAEGGKTLKLARSIAQKERALARACCLLCEQTGFGEDKDGTGDLLLQSTRRSMRRWKAEYGITDDDEYDTQDDF
ncbi:hypothetical protein Agabi119p4_7139 [Agaricus bisporus var. burnettii]|uniref:Uncharacterized protein n=1 Tax=Agaricus bisporus var. burnettii TaxID=192524 RepID=A0A8H7C7J1_AGABI|nr:hypothetical protein Agabi119p4_7139 [Agaricus bisporus var. burnettii]